MRDMGLQNRLILYLFFSIRTPRKVQLKFPGKHLVDMENIRVFIGLGFFSHRWFSQNFQKMTVYVYYVLCICTYLPSLETRNLQNPPAKKSLPIWKLRCCPTAGWVSISPSPNSSTCTPLGTEGRCWVSDSEPNGNQLGWCLISILGVQLLLARTMCFWALW